MKECLYKERRTVFSSESFVLLPDLNISYINYSYNSIMNTVNLVKTKMHYVIVGTRYEGTSD
jgi:hypothetical protein